MCKAGKVAVWWSRDSALCREYLARPSGKNFYFRWENFASVGISYTIFNFCVNISVKKKKIGLHKTREIIFEVLCVTH